MSSKSPRTGLLKASGASVVLCSVRRPLAAYVRCVSSVCGSSVSGLFKASGASVLLRSVCRSWVSVWLALKVQCSLFCCRKLGWCKLVASLCRGFVIVPTTIFARPSRL